MAKKEDSSFFGIFTKTLESLFVPMIMDTVRSSINQIQDAVYHTFKKVLESALAMVLMIVAIVMVVSSFPFVISYYLDVPPSLVVLFTGIVLLIISLIAFTMINNSKYHRRN